MSDDDIMTREETFAMVTEIISVSFGNDPSPNARQFRKKYVRHRDVEDAMDMVTRMIADKFESLPKKASDDFETQEKLQQSIDEMISKMVLLVRQAMDAIPRA